MTYNSGKKWIWIKPNQAKIIMLSKSLDIYTLLVSKVFYYIRKITVHKANIVDRTLLH